MLAVDGCPTVVYVRTHDATSALWLALSFFVINIVAWYSIDIAAVNSLDGGASDYANNLLAPHRDTQEKGHLIKLFYG